MRGTGLLDRDEFFVREHVAFAKLTDTYEILDPQTQSVLGVARETPPSWAKWLRLLVNKRMLPTEVRVTESDPGGRLVLRIARPATFFRAKVAVHDGDGIVLGRFRSKLFSLGGGFWVDDASGNPLAEVKGDWKGWNFKFVDRSGAELGVVTKKWAGLAKEMFTSADNYVVALRPGAATTPNARGLLLAAALAIDIVFKESN